MIKHAEGSKSITRGRSYYTICDLRYCQKNKVTFRNPDSHPLCNCLGYFKEDCSRSRCDCNWPIIVPVRYVPFFMKVGLPTADHCLEVFQGRGHRVYLEVILVFPASLINRVVWSSSFLSPVRAHFSAAQSGLHLYYLGGSGTSNGPCCET